MKIFITGAAGFIGSKLVERLVEKGHDITCLVLENTENNSLRKLDVNLVSGDIRNFDCLKNYFNKITPEIVFHCAGKVMLIDKKGMYDDQAELYAHNVKGTQNICELSYLYGVRRLIYLSSSAVVSELSTGLITDDSEYNPFNKYGESKMEAECLVKKYRSKGVESAIIRPTIVYGEDDPHIWNKILRKISKRLMLIPDIPGIYKNLNLVCIDNVVDVLEIAMYKQEAIEGTFIVADTEIITIRRLFEILYDEMNGSKPIIIPRWLMNIILMVPFYKKMEKKLLKDRVYDISRVRNLLNYVPKIKTEDGLRRVVRYWKKNRGVS